MKILNIVLVMLLIATSVTAISCSCSGGSSPSAVVKEYYTAINSGDVDRARNCIDVGSMLAPGEMDISGREGGIEKIKIVDEEKEKFEGSETASVTVEVYYTAKGSQEHFGRVGDVYNVILEKHRSGWKIELINRTRPITSLGDSDSSDSETEESSIQQTGKTIIYTASNYPKNPKTPAEVFVACYFLSDQYLRGKVSSSAVLDLLSEEVKAFWETLLPEQKAKKHYLALKK